MARIIKIYSYLFVVISILLPAIILCIDLPSDIIKCHFGNVECIKMSMNDVIRRYPKGIPELGIKPMNAIDIEDVVISNPSPNSPEWLSFKFVKQTNCGLENTTITHVDGFERDPTKSRLKIYGTIPSLVHRGKYESQGRILLFHVNATGEAKSDFQNFRFILILKVITEYRYNERYLKITELTPVIDLDRWIIELNDLYNQNSDLTIIMNKVFNDNWVEFWNELEPAILASFGKLIKEFLESFFELIPYDDLFL